MKLNEIKTRLEGLTYQACVETITLMKADLEGEHVNAFAILISDFWNVVASTNERLIEHAKEIKKSGGSSMPECYWQIEASEWGYYSPYYYLFEPNYKIIDEITTAIHDDGAQFEEFPLPVGHDNSQTFSVANEMYYAVIVSVLQKLKKEGMFDDDIFEKDLFLGIQFVDRGLDGLLVIEKASKQLNSEHWHSKVVELRKYYEGMVKK